MIVSGKSHEIRKAIIEILGRGVTVFAGRSGRDEVKRDILFCVVTRYEIPKVKRLINEIDGKSFVTIQTLSDLSGGVIHNPFSPIFQAIDISIPPDRPIDEDKKDK